MSNIQYDYIDDDENDELLNTDSKQYFLFYCDNILYAIPALSVNEILEYQTITKMPLINRSILGVTNIRGSIVGVIDLLERFDSKKTEIDKKTALIVINISHNDAKYNFALLVDEIYEVDGLDQNSITETPSFGTKIKPNFIKSLARYSNKEVYVLDIPKIMDISELSILDLSFEEYANDKMYTRELNNKQTKELEFEEFDADDDDDDNIDINQFIASSSDNTNQYLIFVGPNKQYYASNVSKIDEVIVANDIKIQRNFDNNIIIGTANIRNEILTLVNFDKWLGLDNIDSLLYTQIIVLNVGNHKFGLLVRNTEHIVTIDSDNMTKSSDADTRSIFVSNINLDSNNTLCTIIDSDKILMDVFLSQKDQNEIDFDNIEKLNYHKKIFFADDSGLIRNSLKRIANKLFIKYDIFENGKLLYDMLLKHNIEDIGLIVTDLEMPVMDGKKLIKEIRSKSKFENINILVYTNMANSILSKELIQIGATKVINKLDIKNLSDAIKEFAK